MNVDVMLMIMIVYVYYCFETESETSDRVREFLYWILVGWSRDFRRVLAARDDSPRSHHCQIERSFKSKLNISFSQAHNKTQTSHYISKRERERDNDDLPYSLQKYANQQTQGSLWMATARQYRIEGFERSYTFWKIAFIANFRYWTNCEWGEWVIER